MRSTSVTGGMLERLGTKVYLLWAGLAIGVAFLATPAKFLAPSLSLTVALDIGRHTFRIYNSAELALILALLAMGAGSHWRRRWYLALLVPAAIVVPQALWLIPALDHRVSAILAGQPPPPSSLHTVYIAAEGLKVLWLLAVGLGGILLRSRTRTTGFGSDFRESGWVRIEGVHDHV
jgi:hypothetical protein